MTTATKMHSRCAALVLALFVLAACSTEADGDAEPSKRQEEVAQRGAEVMPFDLDLTSHVFEKNEGGVVQRVIADDPKDAAQIHLVRGHLMEEAARFGAGDFSDPAAIHGTDMPGVKELSAGSSQIDVAYAELAAGAQLTFTTTNDALVRALHAWADAQVSDHGSHAGHE